MFGYEFVNLSANQIEARRKLLDQAGYQAYLAPIVLLSTIAVWRQLSRFYKHEHDASSSGELFRRVSWVLHTTYISEFGPFQVQVLGLLYAGYLLFRVIYQTGDDYMHVTKAFGHVAISQLPMHYLLSVKSPKSPITMLTGLTHERLNAYHRFFGRIIHALMASHAVLYLRFFIAINVLPKRIKDADVRLGVMAFWTMNFLGILAIPPIRAKVYHKVFYRSHVVLSGLLLIVLWFHVPYTRIYVGQAAILWILNGTLRKGTSQPASVACSIAGENLVRVKARTAERHDFHVPGVHVYINQGGLGPRTPFTVLRASPLAKGETQIELIAKNSGGPMTRLFGEAAVDGRRLELQIEGPYGEAQVYMPAFLEKKEARRGKFLIVAGGVGATYAVPIYKALINAKGNASGIEFLWVVRKAHDVEWIHDFLDDKELETGIQFAVTRKGTAELSAGVQKVFKRSKVTYGRPNLRAIVDNFFITKSEQSTKSSHGPFTVMVCGPSSLTKALRTAVGKHVLDNGADVRWYEEQFGFGGS